MKTEYNYFDLILMVFLKSSFKYKKDFKEDLLC